MISEAERVGLIAPAA